MPKVTEKQYQEIGESAAVGLVSVARWIFKECGIEYDFCIQHAGSCGGGIVFGGCARVIWHPKTGWKMDASYCSERFQERFNKILPQLGRWVPE